MIKRNVKLLKKEIENLDIYKEYVSLKMQGIATDEIIKIFNSELQTGKNKIITAGVSKVDVSLSMTDLLSLNQKALKEL